MTKKEPHNLTYYEHTDRDSTWDCDKCGHEVVTFFNGLSLGAVTTAQAAHQCPADAAKKRLKDDVARIEELLDELGVSIQICEDRYYSGSADLMIVDNKTRVERHLETEGVG